MKVVYVSPLRGTFIEGTSLFRLDAPLTVRFADGQSFCVPAGFVSDGNSAWLIFRLLFPRWGGDAGAVVFHDWLYSTQKRPRQECDRRMAAAMAYLLRQERSRIKMVLLYVRRFLALWGVRVWGWTHWKAR